MKKMIIYLIFTGFFIWQSSAQQVIQQPEYKFRNTGSLRIEKITLSGQATTLQLVSEFIPGWWVAFNPEKMYLEDPVTSKRYAPTGAEGIQWGEKKTTPQSGVDTFHFIFPPLPQGTQEINLITGDDAIYGIRLDGSNYYSAIFPREFIGNWYNTQGRWQYGIYEKFVICNNKFWDIQQVKIKGKTLTLKLENDNNQIQLYATLLKDGNCKIGFNQKSKEIYTHHPLSQSGQPADTNICQPFFKPGSTAIIQGYLRGYDTLSGFTTGLIYNTNTVKDEDSPTVVTIHPDGRFETHLSLDYPTLNSIWFNKQTLDFYVTPGDSLMIYLEWEDFLQTDRYRDRSFRNFKTLGFMGQRAETNRDIALSNTLLPAINARKIDHFIHTMTPDQFLEQQMQFYHRTLDSLNRWAEKYHFTPEARQILRNKQYSDVGTLLLDFVMYRKDIKPDPNNKALSTPINNSYFKFLTDVDLSNEYLLVPYAFRFFINRLDTQSPLAESRYAGYPQPAITPEKYGLENIPTLTPEEKDLLTNLPDLNQVGTEEELKQFRENIQKRNQIWEKYPDIMENYKKEYLDPLPSYTDVQRCLIGWQERDRILKNILQLDFNLIYDIIQFHNLTYYLEKKSGAEADSLIQALHITHPYVETLIEKCRTKANQAQQAYSLPEGKATDIFRRIVDPYKGKIVFVDFWATTCGPCRAGIKSMAPIREKFQDKEVAFVFITDEGSSPQSAYDSFVKDVKGHKYRIPESDYNYLRELFHFNGIPRYVLLNREGKVLNDNYNGNLEADLEKLLK